MAGDGRSVEQRRKKEQLIEQVDAKLPPPEVRARLVLEHIRGCIGKTCLCKGDFDTWDVVCFCVEFLGMMTPVFPWLEKDTKSLAGLVYTAHYLHFGGELPSEATRKI